MHVRTARKLLKRFRRYDQEIFVNEGASDEPWIHYCEPRRKISNRVCKMALYCHKDHKYYQHEIGYECHILTTIGLAIKVLKPKTNQ